jgi:hypothetical protein
LQKNNIKNGNGGEAFVGVFGEGKGNSMTEKEGENKRRVAINKLQFFS